MVNKMVNKMVCRLSSARPSIRPVLCFVDLNFEWNVPHLMIMLSNFASEFTIIAIHTISKLLEKGIGTCYDIENVYTEAWIRCLVTWESMLTNCTNICSWSDQLTHTYICVCSCNDLVPNRKDVTWASDDPIHWYIHKSPVAPFTNMV